MGARGKSSLWTQTDFTGEEWERVWKSSLWTIIYWTDDDHTTGEVNLSFGSSVVLIKATNCENEEAFKRAVTEAVRPTPFVFLLGFFSRPQPRHGPTGLVVAPARFVVPMKDNKGVLHFHSDGPLVVSLILGRDGFEVHLHASPLGSDGALNNIMVNMVVPVDKWHKGSLLPMFVRVYNNFRIRQPQVVRGSGRGHKKRQG